MLSSIIEHHLYTIQIFDRPLISNIFTASEHIYHFSFLKNIGTVVHMCIFFQFYHSKRQIRLNQTLILIKRKTDQAFYFSLQQWQIEAFLEVFVSQTQILTDFIKFDNFLQKYL